MALNLDKGQRKELAKALFDTGKLILTGLVIGQFLPNASFRLSTFIIGLMVFTAAFIVAIILSKEGE